MVLAASDNSYTDSYRKYASQGSWEKIENTAMAYGLTTTYYSKKRPKPDRSTNKDFSALAPRRVLGFVFFAGQSQTKVTVVNLARGKQVNTNDKGWYSLEANPEDILVFKALGMKELTIELQEKTTVNVNLEQEWLYL